MANGVTRSGKTTLAQCFLKKYEKQLSIKILDGMKLEKNSHVVLVTAISPYEETRQNARFKCHEFYELYLSTHLNICISRDPKGLYKKALAGEIQNFTGISDPYEIPMQPDFIIDTSCEEIEISLDKLFQLIQKNQK